MGDIKGDKTVQTANDKVVVVDLLDRPKVCTWENCTNLARHQQPGSLIALCDLHENKLNNSIKNLF